MIEKSKVPSIKVISIEANNGRQIELKVHDYITLEEQLCLWHAEICDILKIKCKYRWAEYLESYRCTIGLPQVGRIMLSSAYNHKFWKALSYLGAYKDQIMAELLPKLSMLLTKEEICLLLEYMLRGEERLVYFNVRKTIVDREKTYEDIMCEKKTPSVIEEDKCLLEYVLRKSKEIEEKNKEHEEYWSKQEMKQYYDSILLRFFEKRRAEYAKVRGILKIKKFFSFITLGILGISKDEEDAIYNRYNSLYYVYDEIDNKGKEELSYFIETNSQDLLWAYVVMYAMTTDTYYQIGIFEGCYQMKRGLYRDYIGRYIKQEYESIIKAIKENRNACRKK